MLSNKLSRIAGIEVPLPADNFFHVYQMYTIKVKDGRGKRDALAAYLSERGIMTKVYFPPVHFTHFYKNKLGYNCELTITEMVSQQVLTLPMYPTLTEDEINYMADSVVAFFA
jgi:perosamine synthetase